MSETQDFQEDGPVRRRQDLEKVLAAMTAFIDSPAYVYYVEARRAEIEGKKAEIVSIDPVDRESEIEALKMRGDLRTTQEFLTYFEDTVVNLGERIELLLELEQPNDSNTNTEESNEN